MFSGIVEAVANILETQVIQDKNDLELIRIQVERPSFFSDIHLGDSIAVNGVCLTVEKFTETSLQFAMAKETIKVLQLHPESFKNSRVNLERSLRFGDRIHGHLVTGHVENLGRVVRAEGNENFWFLDVQVEDGILPYLWKKGGVTLHGVSLTINEIEKNKISVCLIPETIKRTNLADFNLGSFIHVEPDFMAKAVVRRLELEEKKI